MLAITQMASLAARPRRNFGGRVHPTATGSSSVSSSSASAAAHASAPRRWGSTARSRGRSRSRRRRSRASPRPRSTSGCSACREPASRPVVADVQAVGDEAEDHHHRAGIQGARAQPHLGLEEQDRGDDHQRDLQPEQPGLDAVLPSSRRRRGGSGRGSGSTGTRSSPPPARAPCWPAAAVPARGRTRGCYATIRRSSSPGPRRSPILRDAAHAQGKHAVEFFTQTKVVVERWLGEWSRTF